MVRFVDDPVSVPVDELGPFEEVVHRERHVHTRPPSSATAEWAAVRVPSRPTHGLGHGQFETITVLDALVVVFPAASNAVLLT